eukprot:CAMPEP_0198728878 /NCGR_PEP_ID=MMETSP1475-20131203/11884_1 /TAXON_ID= ORGANISM="Unidentified sp., Strain CCMP1999" /NCGR_SAMPLE_ID=MMETSP1475 /ASSEMBLY_ACC=CAM_ASM_001111 /LENGTH=327 /DNA_ID=CAMNT_0044491353 /DNA_START=218 /DNA_END=1201 /DNA_ORIENTATION=+
MAKTYADVNVLRSPTFWNYDLVKIQWGGQDQYDVVRKVGRGKYSDVFEAINCLNNKRCIVKVLKPVKPRKIRREISILQTLCGGRNIVKLLDLCLDPDSKVPSLVFEYVNNADYRSFFSSWGIDNVRQYIYEVLEALDYAHANGIMHRDIKPQNIMYDPSRKKLRVIDWGLAEYYHPHKEYNVRVASRYYKGPELLIDLQDYDYSLDIWSLGCVLAGIIFMKEPMFKGRDNEDQLVQIARVLGSEDLFQYMRRYGILLDDEFMLALENHPKRPWSSFINSANAHLATTDAVDLLSHMLRYDHQTRYTAREAMRHPFFNSIRQARNEI